MIKIFILLLLMLVAYLLGSIPSGVWVGKKFYHVDVRNHGSKNIGTTNTYRVLGPVAGTIVLFMDVGKGFLATWIPSCLGFNSWHPLIFGVIAVLGHTFSIFDHFKGGKAVATSAGMLLAYNPLFFLIAALVFISCILITSMVSLGSMLGFIIIVGVSFCTHDIFLTVIAFGLTCFTFYRHRNNIKKILKGNENIVPFGLYYWYLKYVKKSIR